jgi:hypothetical protein
MRQLRGPIAILLCFVAALLLAFPLGMYWLGLSGVDGFPQKPLQLVPKEQQVLVWRDARGDGAPRIEAMNPYSFAITLLVDGNLSAPPDQLIVWRVASSYLIGHQRNKGMGWWHLSGAALTIWLSRNWTSEEILSAAALSR